MGQMIGDILPLAIGIAISPVPIIAIILMLITPQARRNGLAFLGGWMLGLLVVGGLVIVVANVADVAFSSTPSHAAYIVRLVLGVLLLVFAVRQWRGRPAAGTEAPLPKWMRSLDSFTLPRALVVAALLSGVNPKNLVLNVAAATDIAQSALSGIQQAAVLVVFVVLASLSIIAPVVVYLVKREKAAGILGDWKTWLAANNAAVMTVLLLVFGAVLVGKGITGLA